MKQKIIVFLIMMLLITTFYTSSTGYKIDKSENLDFSQKINPIDMDVSSADPGDPTVVITSPNNGVDLPYNYLLVIGYATDPDGIYFIEWSYQSSGGYYYYNNSTVPGYLSMSFEFGITNIQQGTHTVTVSVYDAFDNVGTDSVTVTYGLNDNPNQPSQPRGPSTGSINTEYSYTTHATDPNGDDVKYGWDWDGDGRVDEWTRFHPSGQSVQTSHSWPTRGTYNVQVKAEDEGGKQSRFSPALQVTISANAGPDQPSKPGGKTNGASGKSYSYSTSTSDPQSDRIYYMFDWDDETELVWDGPYDSGDICIASHIYSAKGSYAIRVKAIDDPNGDGELSDGIESIWSDPLAISMPKTKTLFETFMSRIPFLKHFFSFLF